MALPSFLSPKYVEHEVNGQRIKFFPLSLALGFRLKATARPLLRLIAKILERDGDSVTARKINQMRAPDGIEQDETLIEAISLDLYEARMRERGALIDEFVENFFAPETHMLLVEIIMDSCRLVEEWKRGPGEVYHPTKLVEETKNGMDIQVTLEFLRGVLKANGQIMGPLGEQVMAQVKAVTEDRFRQASNQSSNGPQSSTDSTSESTGRNASGATAPQTERPSSTPTTETMPHEQVQAMERQQGAPMILEPGNPLK